MARLHREVLAVLVAEIVDGTFAPGTWLPREVDLAARFSISRGTSRECIRALEERGLVSVRHGKGAMVRPDTDWDVLDREVVTALLSSSHRSRVLGEVLQCRRALELTAVELAAERVTSAQLDQMRTAYRQMEQAVARQVQFGEDPASERAFLEADLRFHRLIMEASGNRALAQMLEPMQHALFLSRYQLARPQARLERGLPEHLSILQAIEARDPQAAHRAMAAHLSTVESYRREVELQAFDTAPGSTRIA